MYHQRLSDETIIYGFRRGDAGIIREFFYGWCQAGYHIYDQRYQLSGKENLDFMSLAHQYALYLMEHDWKPLEDHSPVSQKYKRLKEDIIVPYFKKYFDMDLDMPEVMDEMAILRREAPMEEPRMVSMPSDAMPMSDAMAYEDMDFIKEEIMEQKRLQRHTLTSGQRLQRHTLTSGQRTTPERITSLEPNEIFVFGSNLKGMHGGGAAYIAYRKFGAVMGQGVGLQGQSYGIPTMQGGVETIRPYVDEFIEFARQHPELTFLVTRIGCGIAGFTDEEISPLFEAAHGVENIVLPPNW